ncbi:hypothetical protein DZC78_10090 [Olleya aquimaris]|nr:hypothetical protein DZC78_10090 [Olleya aquimaris]
MEDIAKLLTKLRKYKPIRNKFPYEALPKDGYILNYILDAKGLFRQLNGNILPNRPLNFVITKGGYLKIGIRHHLLGNGEDVLMAGGIRFKNGKIAELNNLSGHYKPTPEQASVLESLLKDVGLPVKRAKYEISTISSNSNGYATGTKKVKTIFIDNINL